jgi:hypothetical protein
MKRFALTVAGALVAAIVFIAQIATADPASQTTGAVLTHRQVLQIALREAERSMDPHPKRIEMASGSPRAAMSVMDPTGRLGSGVNEEVVVDLVVMHGYFHINGSPPPGRSIPPGKVMEFIIDAHTGLVAARSLSNREPVALLHLGPVTRLR